MFYIIYKITNNINNKIYVGSHKTEHLNDRYLGSGKILSRAIEKHGIKNFTKEILFIFDNPKDMYAKEAEIVNENFVTDDNTYNLKIGGLGGFDHINRDVEFRIAKNKKARKITNMQYKNKISEWSQLGGRRSFELHGNPNKNGISKGFLGKKHSPETIEKMKISRAKRNKG